MGRSGLFQAATCFAERSRTVTCAGAIGQRVIIVGEKSYEAGQLSLQLLLGPLLCHLDVWAIVRDDRHSRASNLDGAEEAWQGGSEGCISVHC